MCVFVLVHLDVRPCRLPRCCFCRNKFGSYGSIRRLLVDGHCTAQGRRGGGCGRGCGDHCRVHGATGRWAVCVLIKRRRRAVTSSSSSSSPLSSKQHGAGSGLVNTLNCVRFFFPPTVHAWAQTTACRLHQTHRRNLATSTLFMSIRSAG